jgi:hypothetical protein
MGENWRSKGPIVRSLLCPVCWTIGWQKPFDSVMGDSIAVLGSAAFFVVEVAMASDRRAWAAVP